MKRFRPYRVNQETRDRYADVHLPVQALIYPYFVVEGMGVKEEIGSMPGVFRYSIDLLTEDVGEALSLGIDKILLFGVVDNAVKDSSGSAGYAPDLLIVRAVRAVKAAFPQVTVITDVCLCEYTDHGHCGLLDPHHDVENDTTLPLLAEMAFRHAEAGADFVAPSSMMDGQIEAIKKRLAAAGLSTPVLAYSAKYASAFYGPFRDAAQSVPGFGDRKSYQMDFRTSGQGLEEIEADIAEGAAWVMVKPAMAYLDIIVRARSRFTETPLVVYQVSGEYSMLKAAAQAGYLDEERTFYESLIAIRRAGADYIITYYAKEYAKLWKE
ncbi:MAG: porphobilinogen synthase [Bacteroides sp.]|nr:porphobilinogen synthase [Bacteroides sp.]